MLNTHRCPALHKARIIVSKSGLQLLHPDGVVLSLPQTQSWWSSAHG